MRTEAGAAASGATASRNPAGAEPVPEYTREPSAQPYLACMTSAARPSFTLLTVKKHWKIAAITSLSRPCA